MQRGVYELGSQNKVNVGTGGTYPVFQANDAPPGMRRRAQKDRQQRRTFFYFNSSSRISIPRAPGEKTALRFLLRQGQRLLIRSTGLGNPSYSATLIRTGRVREGTVGEVLARQRPDEALG